MKTYSPACAKEILFFNEAYYGLYEVCMRMERDEEGREEFARRGDDRLARMDQSLLSFSSSCRRAMRSSGNLKRIGTGKNSGWKGWP